MTAPPVRDGAALAMMADERHELPQAEVLCVAGVMPGRSNRTRHGTTPLRRS